MAEGPTDTLPKQIVTSGLFPSEENTQDQYPFSGEYISDGVTLNKVDDHFDVQIGEKIIGSLQVFPGTVRYNDLLENKVYHADIDADKYHPPDKKDLPLPVNIQAIAADLRQQREIEYSKRTTVVQDTKPSTFSLDIKPGQGALFRNKEKSSLVSDLLLKVFPDTFGNLSVLDIASGYGEFPLGLAQNAEKLGIAKITASDLHTELLDGHRSELEELGVEIIRLDAKNPDISRKFDIVTLNAPQASGKNAFADEALTTALSLINTPGLILFRINEGSDDMGYKPRWVVPKKFPIIEFDQLEGLPESMYARGFLGKGTATVYAILNLY